MNVMFVGKSHRLVGERASRIWSVKNTGELGQEITTFGLFGTGLIRSVRDASETTTVTVDAVLSLGTSSGSSAASLATLFKTLSLGAMTVMVAVSLAPFVRTPKT